METRCKRFEDISISEKLLYSLFLMTIGIGYLFALTHMLYTHQMRDGEPGISVQDVMIAYYGSRDQTRLGSAIDGGPMEPNLKSGADKQVILNWLQTDKSEQQYTEVIAPILNRDCTLCHSPAINPALPNLSTYAGVMAVAKSKAASLPSLVKVSHIHLFGIAFILLFVGRIFIYCDFNVTFKRIIVVIPFLAMIIDTFSWFVTRQVPQFAYVVVASGALMGIAMGAQIVISLYQMWVDVFPGQLRLLSKWQWQQWPIFRALAAVGALFRLKLSPLLNQFGLRVIQLGRSLYHIGLYKLHDCLGFYANDRRGMERLKAKQYTDVLHDYGYDIISNGNGWLVKESLYSWHFLDSISKMEHYVKAVKAKIKAVKKV
ncbi:MAG: hypothetical protein ABL903_07130 [Methylococcales bacterium]